MTVEATFVGLAEEQEKGELLTITAESLQAQQEAVLCSALMLCYALKYCYAQHEVVLTHPCAARTSHCSDGW